MSGLKQEHDAPLITAVYEKNVDQCHSLTQTMDIIYNETLVAMINFGVQIDVFNAAMNHSSIDPFYDNNCLIKIIIERNYSTDYLSAVLRHSKNKLNNDDYRKIITDMNPVDDKLSLIESLIV